MFTNSVSHPSKWVHLSESGIIKNVRWGKFREITDGLRYLSNAVTPEKAIKSELEQVGEEQEQNDEISINNKSIQDTKQNEFKGQTLVQSNKYSCTSEKAEEKHDTLGDNLSYKFLEMTDVLRSPTAVTPEKAGKSELDQVIEEQNDETSIIDKSIPQIIKNEQTFVESNGGPSTPEEDEENHDTLCDYLYNKFREITDGLRLSPTSFTPEKASKSELDQVIEEQEVQNDEISINNKSIQHTKQNELKEDDDEDEQDEFVESNRDRCTSNVAEDNQDDTLGDLYNLTLVQKYKLTPTVARALIGKGKDMESTAIFEKLEKAINDVDKTQTLASITKKNNSTIGNLNCNQMDSSFIDKLNLSKRDNTFRNSSLHILNDADLMNTSINKMNNSVGNLNCNQMDSSFIDKLNLSKGDYTFGNSSLHILNDADLMDTDKTNFLLDVNELRKIQVKSKEISLLEESKEETKQQTTTTFMKMRNNDTFLLSPFVKREEISKLKKVVYSNDIDEQVNDYNSKPVIKTSDISSLMKFSPNTTITIEGAADADRSSIEMDVDEDESVDDNKQKNESLSSVKKILNQNQENVTINRSLTRTLLTNTSAKNKKVKFNETEFTSESKAFSIKKIDPVNSPVQSNNNQGKNSLEEIGKTAMFNVERKSSSMKQLKFSDTKLTTARKAFAQRKLKFINSPLAAYIKPSPAIKRNAKSFRDILKPSSLSKQQEKQLSNKKINQESKSIPRVACIQINKPSVFPTCSLSITSNRPSRKNLTTKFGFTVKKDQTLIKEDLSNSNLY